jgi:hypothetical protein
MRLSLVIGAGLLALAMAPAPASAVPALGGGAGVSAASDTSPLIKVHGWHQACRPGYYGWHRHSYRWGRVGCGPVYHHWRRHHRHHRRYNYY